MIKNIILSLMLIFVATIGPLSHMIGNYINND